MEAHELHRMAPGTKIFVKGRHGVERAVFERMARTRAHIRIGNARWTFAPRSIIGIDNGGPIPEVKRVPVPNDLKEGDILLLGKSAGKEYMKFVEYKYSTGHIIVEDGNGKGWRYKMAGDGFYGVVARAIPEDATEIEDEEDAVDETPTFSASVAEGSLTEG